MIDTTTPSSPMKEGILIDKEYLTTNDDDNISKGIVKNAVKADLVTNNNIRDNEQRDDDIIERVEKENKFSIVTSNISSTTLDNIIITDKNFDDIFYKFIQQRNDGWSCWYNKDDKSTSDMNKPIPSPCSVVITRTEELNYKDWIMNDSDAKNDSIFYFGCDSHSSYNTISSSFSSIGETESNDKTNEIKLNKTNSDLNSKEAEEDIILKEMVNEMNNEIDNNDIFAITLADDYNSQHYSSNDHYTNSDNNDSCFMAKSSTEAGESESGDPVDTNGFNAILPNDSFNDIPTNTKMDNKSTFSIYQSASNDNSIISTSSTQTMNNEEKQDTNLFSSSFTSTPSSSFDTIPTLDESHNNTSNNDPNNELSYLFRQFNDLKLSFWDYPYSTSFDDSQFDDDTTVNQSQTSSCCTTTTSIDNEDGLDNSIILEINDLHEFFNDDTTHRKKRKKRTKQLFSSRKEQQQQLLKNSSFSSSSVKRKPYKTKLKNRVLNWMTSKKKKKQLSTSKSIVPSRTCSRKVHKLRSLSNTRRNDRNVYDATIASVGSNSTYCSKNERIYNLPYYSM